MSTSEELRQQIAAKQRELQDKHRLKSQLLEEVQQANDRQRLRRELERVQEECDICASQNAYIRFKKACIDRDTHGDHLPDGDPVVCPRLDSSAHCMSTNDGQVLNCGNAVTKGEYRWKLEGLSWLEHSLRQSYSVYLESDVFRVGDEDFLLAYHSKGGTFERGSHQCGSLVIIHQNDEPDDGITFRYRFFIKDGEDWVQWGATGDECHPDGPPNGRVFGPDVQVISPARRPTPHAVIGIFGMKHKDLLKSKWVVDDSLTVKVELEVRSPHDCARAALQPAVNVPPPTIAADLLAGLENGKHCDVTFLVEGQRLKAHSFMLAARSEIFDKLLSAGMHETVSKEIKVEDSSAATFKALLQFLYTDDFAYMEELVKKSSSGSGAEGNTSSSDTSSISNGNSSSSSDSTVAIPPPSEGSTGNSSTSNSTTDIANPSTNEEQPMCLLQCLLAVSHKYEVNRLLLWCEEQLCNHITSTKASSMLCQAHLYGAKQLEEACLNFIKQNMQAVVVTPDFKALCKDWPDVMLKINLYSAGVSESSATAALESPIDGGSTSSTLKRKREE